MKRTEILVSGFGGQGVVRLGQILSTAAVNEGLYTTMLISHGTETRGGYVRSQIVISGAPIDSPVVEKPDYFCAMSKSAYTKFSGLVSGGTIIYDPGFIEPDQGVAARHLVLPAKEIAVEKLGKDVFANILFLGVLGRMLSPVISQDNLRLALEARVPKYLADNIRAFELGYEYIKQ